MELIDDNRQINTMYVDTMSFRSTILFIIKGKKDKNFMHLSLLQMLLHELIWNAVLTYIKLFPPISN